MKIVISRMSWHAQLYRWFYHTWKLPISLCGYFWKMLIAVLISPFLFILGIPSFAVIKFFKGWKWFRNNVEDTHPTHYAFAGTLLYGCAWLFIHTIMFVIHKVNKQPYTNNELISTVLLMFSVIAATAVFIGACYSSWKSERENDLYNEFRRTHPGMGWLEFYDEKEKKGRLSPENWLLTRAIIAWYTKACPIIDWKH